MAVVTIQQSVAALYVAVFNRAPDQAGLNAWTNAITSGQSTFAQVAAGFAAHEVFTTGIGALSNTAYVAALYTNILGSAGDAAGIANWTAQLNAGQSKAAVAALFVQAALTVDIPAMLAAGSLTAAEAAAATVRQDTLTNKANTGIYFAETLKAASNLNPLTVQSSKAGLEADPIYNASKAAIANVTNTAASVQSAKDAISVAAGTANPAQSLLGGTFTLTAGINEFTGTAANDIFSAVEAGSPAVATFTNLDKLDGGAGTDTLKIVQAAAVDTTSVVGATVTNIENINITSGAGVTTNTSTWTGATALNIAAGSNVVATAAATTDITAAAAALTGVAGAVTVNGGKNVTVTAADTSTTGAASANTILVGGTTAAAGAVKVTYTETISDAADAGVAGSSISVTGGTTVEVNSLAVAGAGSAAADVLTLGQVTVNGNASTTAVTVKQSAATAVYDGATQKNISIANGAVTIVDGNAATAADTIKTVSLENFGTAGITSTVLDTLNLTGGSSAALAGGSVTLTKSAADTSTAATTLALNLNGGFVGAVSGTHAADFTSVNVASSANSTLADVSFAAATTLNVSGAGTTTLTALNAANVKLASIVSSGAGLTIGSELATNVAVTGGAGVENIMIGATTKVIDLGAGNDVVTVSNTTMGAGGAVKGGDGIDTLVANTNGSAFAGLPAFTGFETLRVAGAAAVGAHNAVGFTALETGATSGATTFTNVAKDVGLTVLAADTGGVTVTLADATGTADTFGLALKSAGVLDLSTTKGVTLAGVETINLTNTDTDTTAHTNKLNLTANSVKSLVVTGNAGLDLSGSTYIKVTNFDASGITGAAKDAAALGVTYVSGNTTVGENVSIKGGSGNDFLTGNAANNDTINGGAGIDTLTYNGGADVFTGGAGADIFVVGALGTKASHLTIADAAKTDVLNFVAVTTGTLADVNAAGMVAAKVTLGAAATLDQYLDAAAARDGNTNAVFSWFQQGGSTYAVIDNTAGATFAATDAVIQLTGLVDLSTATITGEALTFA